MSSDDNRLDRRSVLKTIGSAAVAGVGVSATTGTVAAVQTKRRLTRAYSDETRLRFAFEQHGEGLRQTLVDEGFVAEDFEFGALDFDVDPEVIGVEPTADDRLAGVAAITQDGTATAFASVSTSSDTHDISLFVQPERDEAYALVEPKGGGDRVLVTEDEVSPQGCSYEGCTTDCCGGDKEAYYKTWDCDSNCENCKVVDASCTCETCECATSGHAC